MTHPFAPASSSPLTTPPILSQSPPATTPSSSTSSSPTSSPQSRPRRLPRVNSRKRITPRPSLSSIVEEGQPGSINAPSSTGRESSSSIVQSSKPSDHGKEGVNVVKSGAVPRPLNWNGKSGISVGKGMRDVCGICFEVAVKPNKTRCCGQLFCFQHLSDWLNAQGADGRCPSCRVPLSIESDTIFLHPPQKVTVSLPPPLRPTLRSTSSLPRALRPGLAILHSRHREPSSNSSGSDARISETSSSDSEDSIHPRSRGRRTPPQQSYLVYPQYESVQDLFSALVPLREFGSLLSVVGCALVVGTLLT
ncbi:hypothetical protein OF83DRAFT_495952 [Amylostereum chailletii]|nr:hypothetical protein OF83DRAFT_495952 [Amylostereum chailletii]